MRLGSSGRDSSFSRRWRTWTSIARRSRVAVRGVAPDGAQELLAVEGVAGPRHQATEQLELAEGEPDRVLLDGHAAQVAVQRDGADAQVALNHAALRATQHGADSRPQLRQAEGLRDVVIRAGFEALDGVGLAVERG